MKSTRVLGVLAIILVLSLLASTATASKFDVPSIFTTQIKPNMTCSNTFFGYNISSIAQLDHVETGIGTSALVIGVTLPVQISLSTNISAFVQKGTASMAAASSVGIFYWNDTLKNVTTYSAIGSVCGTVQINSSAVANASNNFEGWYASNITQCNLTYSNQTNQANLSVWTTVPKTLVFRANQTSWFKVVTNYKPVLGYTAYDTYINVSGFVPCFAWQNTSYTFRKNLTVMNGYSVTLDWLPLFLSSNFTKNLTASLANGSDIIPADDFNGQYPVVHYNFNQTGGLTVFSPNITAGANWSGNASIYYNGTPVDESGALVFKNFTGMWLFADMNDSRGINAMTASPSVSPVLRLGDDGVCKFGRCLNITATGGAAIGDGNGANLSIAGFKTNSSAGATWWIRGSRSHNGQNFYYSGGACSYTNAWGWALASTSGSNMLFAFNGLKTQISCGTPALNAMFEYMFTIDAGGMTCFLDGVNTSFTGQYTSLNWSGFDGFEINRGGESTAAKGRGCEGWSAYLGGVNVTDFVAFANFSTGKEGVALFNLSSGITATSEWSQFEVQAGVANIAPLVTLISPANAVKLTTGTLAFQFNASDGDNVTFLSATLWRNATNASYLANVAANFTATFNVTTHPNGNFTWNVTVDDGVDLGNSSKRTFMVVPANTAPTITLVAPLNNNVTNSATPINFSSTITDHDNTTLQWCAARLNTTTIIGNVSSVTSPGSFNASVSELGVGNYSWNTICSDGLAEASGSARNLMIVPVNNAPVIFVISPINLSNVTTGFINFTFNITDGENSTMERISFVRNGTYLFNLTGVTVNVPVLNFSIQSFPEGNWSWQINASDGITSTASVGRNLYVASNNTPIFATMTLQNVTVRSATMQIAYNVTDADGDTINYSVILFRNGINAINTSTNLATQGITTSADIDRISLAGKWYGGDNFTINVTAKDLGGNIINRTITGSVSNVAPVIMHANASRLRSTVGDTLRFTILARDADGDSTISNVYIKFSKYNLSLTATGNTPAYLNFTIGANNDTGNFSWNVTAEDNSGGSNTTQFVAANMTITILNLSSPLITGTTNAYQKQYSVRIGRDHIQPIQYLRQLAVVNKNLLPLNVSLNSTMPARVVNSTLNVTEDSGAIIGFSINSSDVYINFTMNVSANSSRVFNITYNLTALTTLNYTDECAGEGSSSGTCVVTYAIANNHTNKLHNLTFYFSDADLPHWDQRGSVTVQYNLKAGTGGGVYEKFLVNTSVNETNNNTFASFKYTDGDLGAFGGESYVQGGSNDANAGLTSALGTLFSNTSLFTENFTTTIDTTAASTSITDFALGSLTVKGLDVGGSSTYELKVSYAWTTATQGGTGGGGGGGGGGAAPLTLKEGNESYIVETDRGGSKYDLFATYGNAKTKPVKVTNAGDIAANLLLECEAGSPKNACDFVKFNASNLLVVPKQSKSTTFTFLAPKGTSGDAFEFNIVVRSDTNPRIKGRLPVTITISTAGFLFDYFNKWTGWVTIAAPVEGGKDLNIPVAAIAIISLIISTAAIGSLFVFVLKMTPTLGWTIASIVGALVAIIIPALT